MSRARKPVDMQSKHLTQLERKEKEQAESNVIVGREQLARPPCWLIDKAAKLEFKRIVKEFEKINVVGNLDLNNIAGYCNAYAFYRKVTAELALTQITVIGETGEKIINPLYANLCKNQREYADEMRKFAALCGLTIDSRLKVGTVQVNKTTEKIDEEFGCI